eukprot:CAMPEP_0173059208 /NCGR_PEP_ID=MMETSP1102-20130122/1829_1 /TAXON_ID=49646 /ORGANISM="Geminigera sp., Strain Caron Lab Isolate" /LENGTH=238 /DNA_ID=CAMNT_0013925131 /DNA_START=13 /DNA_END=726 /DNA_ORIENTATION=-
MGKRKLSKTLWHANDKHDASPKRLLEHAESCSCKYACPQCGEGFHKWLGAHGVSCSTHTHVHTLFLDLLPTITDHQVQVLVASCAASFEFRTNKRAPHNLKFCDILYTSAHLKKTGHSKTKTMQDCSAVSCREIRRTRDSGLLHASPTAAAVTPAKPTKVTTEAGGNGALMLPVGERRVSLGGRGRTLGEDDRAVETCGEVHDGDDMHASGNNYTCPDCQKGFEVWAQCEEHCAAERH